MEAILTNKINLQYSNVYAKDLVILKHHFLALNHCKELTQEFGLPFLIIKKNKKVIAFSSLININNEKIGIHNFYTSSISDEEKAEIEHQSNLHFSNGMSSNFKDVAQLQVSINQLIFWLNS